MAEFSISRSNVSRTYSSSSDEDEEELQQLFESMDMDKSGYVTLEEMVFMEKIQAESRGDIFNEPERRAYLERFLRQNDLDQDMKLNFQEFVMAMRSNRDLDGFSSDSDSVLYDSGRSMRRMGSASRNLTRRKRRNRKRSMSSSRNSKATPVYLLPESGLTSPDAGTWEKIKNKPLDANHLDMRKVLRQMFDTLNKQKNGSIDLDELLQLRPHLAKVIAASEIEDPDSPPVDVQAEKQLTDIHKKHARNNGLKLGFNEFVSALESLELTNTGIRHLCVSYLWSQIKKVPLDSATDYEMDKALNIMRFEVIKAASSTVKESKIAMRLRKQVQLAVQIAEKYKQASMSDEKQTSGSGTVEPKRLRTHAERNQEFFFLTALATKLNIEARYKQQNQVAPKLPPTRALYEKAMAQRVPFQFYHKWLLKEVDPAFQAFQKQKEAERAAGKK